MGDPAPVQLRCPAKVNLALSVGATDVTGMHSVASWQVAVQWADDLWIGPSEDRKSHFDLAFDAQVPGPVDWPLERDLSYRAAMLMQEHIGAPRPIRLRLRKRIPAGAGLGGGSSNAAGVLVGLNRLWALGLDTDALVQLGRPLGSDVGFCVQAICGRPAAVVSGLGYCLELLPAPALHLVLILPPYACSTAAVYRQFDRLGPKRAGGPNLAAVRALAGAMNTQALFNDLAEAACCVQLPLGPQRRQLAHVLGRAVHVTGSGSALFVMATGTGEAGEVAGHVRRRCGLAAVATQTLPDPGQGRAPS